jgi:hypothetical protein
MDAENATETRINIMAKSAVGSGNRGNKSGSGSYGKKPRDDNPPNLGNIKLRVIEYKPLGNEMAVRGKDIFSGRDITVALASPTRAANMLRTANDEEKRLKANEFAEKFENRKSLGEFATPSSMLHVPIGGVIALTNVRLDFASKDYFAERAFPVIVNPERQVLMTGIVQPSVFADGGLRIQLFQNKEAVALRADVPEAQAANRSALASAFDVISPVGGQLARVAMVTVSDRDDNGYVNFNTYYAKSHSTEVDGGKFKLSSGFMNTLNLTTLDDKGGAWAVMAAVAGVEWSVVEARANSDTAKDLLRDIYMSVKQAGPDLKISLTPGFAVPVLKVRVDAMKQIDSLMNNSFEGGVALATHTKDGLEMERPATYEIFSAGYVIKGEDGGRSPSYFAEGAHRAIHNIVFQKPNGDTASNPSPSSTSPDF